MYFNRNYEVVESSISGDNRLITIQDIVPTMKTDFKDSITGLIDNAIGYVSSQFESYCQRPLKSQTYRGFYSGDGSKILELKSYPINEIYVLQYRNSIKDNWKDLIVSPLTFENEIYVFKSYIQNHQIIFPCGIQNIKIEYNAGFEEVPEEIKRIAIEAVINFYDKSKQGDGSIGLRNKTQSDKSFSFYDIWDEHKRVLDTYKRLLYA